MIKILAFAGSARADSFNRKLIAIAAQGAETAGAEVTVVDLRDYAMPIFDQDYEAQQGMPENARQLKRHLIASDGILISSPEYNSGYSGLLKNCIDWVSRAEAPDEKRLIAFRGKCVSLMSASPGKLGGIRGLAALRILLSNLGMTVSPGQVAVPNAVEAFDEEGQLVDEEQQQAIVNLAIDLVTTLNE